MPIRPEKQKLYPPKKAWAKIRAEVLARDRNKCRGCGLRNYTYGIRWRGGGFYCAPLSAQISPGASSRWAETSYGDDLHSNKGALIHIVLTIAHMDHDPTNNGKPGKRPNLRALCQRCHNRYDREHRQANARETRAKKKGTTDGPQRPL